MTDFHLKIATGLRKIHFAHGSVNQKVCVTTGGDGGSKMEDRAKSRVLMSLLLLRRVSLMQSFIRSTGFKPVITHILKLIL